MKIRKEDDVTYNEGDFVLLKETIVVDNIEAYTDSEILVEVKNVYRDLPGLKKNYCIFTFSIIRKVGC